VGSLKLAGRYLYVGELGSGATSRVLALVDETTQTPCAAKVLESDAGARAVWELDALRRAESPHLVRAMELLRINEALPPPFATPKRAWFLIESRAPGEVSSRRLLDVSEEARGVWLKQVTIGVLEALDALHAAGLTHGDVKPENVLVEGAHATVIDLGLAEPVGRHGHVSGTPHFLAPEAREGERSVATDLYALGVTMFAWMHGALIDPIDAPPSPSWVSTEVATLAQALVQERVAARPCDARDALAQLGVERKKPAHRAIPFVGGRGPIDALLTSIGLCGYGEVVGPAGSGRSRIIEEAARATQARLAREGASVPTFLRSATLPWDLTTSACVHLTRDVEPIQIERFLAATRLRGFTPWLAMARTEATEATAAPRGAGRPSSGLQEPLTSHPSATAPAIIEPLDAASVARVLEIATGERPTAAAVQAAQRSTLGYAGRLVRTLPLLVASDLDPLRASDWREGTWATREEQPQSKITRDFFAMVSALGGSIALESPDASSSEAARAALREGLVTQERDGAFILRDDIREASLPAKSSFARHAKRALSMGASGTSWAAAHWHLKQRDKALDAMQGIAQNALAEGDPERAREALERFLRVAPDAREALALIHADACRAEGDFALALQATEHAAATKERDLARADLYRLQGRLADASQTLALPTIAPGDVDAAALRSRVALSQGDLTQALTEASHATSDAHHPAAIARGEETLALIALLEGRALDAEASATRGRAAAARVPRAAQRHALQARAISLLAQAQAQRGEMSAGAALHEESARLAHLAGDRLLDATFSFNAGLASLETGQLGKAIALLERSALVLTRLGRDAERGRTIANLANALALVGDEARATHLANEASVAAERSGDVAAVALAAIVRADIAMAQGKLRSAALALDSLTHEGPFEAIAWARRAHLHAIQGDHRAADAALDASHPHDARGHAERGLAKARLELDREQPARARVALEELPRGLDFEMQVRAHALAADVSEALRDQEGKRRALTLLRELVEPALRALTPSLQAHFRQLPHVRRALTEGGASAAGDAERPLREALEGAARVSSRSTWKSALAELTETALRVCAAERAFVVAWEGGEARVVSRAGIVDAHARPSTSLVLRALRERVVTTSDAIASSDASASVHALALRSVIAVQLASRVDEDERRTSYVLVADDRLRPAAFDPHVVESIRALSDICGPVLEARLETRRLRREVKSQVALALTLAQENERQRESMRGLRQGDAFDGFIHASESTRVLIRDARRLAHSNLSVLITGETGTGKSLLARCIHLASERRHAPFVAEEGAAFTSELLESTLFGHVRGAFTGADRARQGLFELAHGGTLFLDGIDEAPPSVQAKLLRVLVEGVVRPVGSDREKRVDVRVIAALHHATEERVPSRLREDLFYRLAGATLTIPPLRQRPEDLDAITQAKLPIGGVTLDPEAYRALHAHRWPGNVRELEHVLTQARLHATGVIHASHLQLPSAEASVEVDLHRMRGALTRELVLDALRRNQQNRTRAARELGISRFGLQKILKRFEQESKN